MTEADAARLAAYRDFMKHDLGVTAPDVAFFLRLLDESQIERDALLTAILQIAGMEGQEGLNDYLFTERALAIANDAIDAYGGAELAAALAAERDRTIEECALLCEGFAYDNPPLESASKAGYRLRDRIRALKAAPPTEARNDERPPTPKG